MNNNYLNEYNSLTPLKVAQNTDESNRYLIEHSNDSITGEDIGRNIGIRLHHLEKFVDHIIKTKLPGFTTSHKQDGRYLYGWTKLSERYFPYLDKYLDLYSPNLFYSPKVGLFFTICIELSLFGNSFVNPNVLLSNRTVAGESFNSLIQRLREEGNKPEFRKKSYRRSEGSKRQYCSLVSYTNALFQNRRSRLIVIRIDLRYKANNGSAMRSNQAKEDLSRLMTNMRSKPRLFGDLEGYIWKLECGNEGAEHFHFIFFFNNDHHQKDDWLGEVIGKYWEEAITSGRGTYFNCNRRDYKAKQKRLGIGRVEANDVEKRSNLSLVLAYLCKSDQLIKAKTTKRFRSIGRGELTEERTVRRGAPRTINS